MAAFFVDREAERRRLALPTERGIAVIVNRPFRQGALTHRLKVEPLPEWAAELGVLSWSKQILKFIRSHPAVTVAIPATTRVDQDVFRTIDCIVRRHRIALSVAQLVFFGFSLISRCTHRAHVAF